MNDQYDAIVLGTGLKECIISGVLSVDGLKVLHMDRNNYYGGDSASLNLDQLFEKFAPNTRPPEALGKSRDYNVDLIPKFIMATGNLTKILIHTRVTRYLEFRGVSGSYVYREGKIHKVPTNEREAIASDLMGFFEKRRCAKFLNYVQDYNQADPKTHKGLDCSKATAADLYAKFSLEPNTQEFIGHALALFTNDEYVNRTASELIQRIVLYKDSLVQYTGKSPYIYPRYGLGELPQAFARHAAVYGGTYMLNKPVEEIVYNEKGEAVGVKSEGEVARANFIVADPSYFPTKVKEIGKVVRTICILGTPVPNTGNMDSLQIIIPRSQVGRQSDIYVMCLASDHNVCAKGKYIAIVSTIAETANPEQELAPALALLAGIEHKFTQVTPMLVPLANGKEDKCFISTSYDPQSHFETATDDVLDIYKRITGKDMDLTPPPPEAEEASA